MATAMAMRVWVDVCVCVTVNELSQVECQTSHETIKWLPSQNFIHIKLFVNCLETIDERRNAKQVGGGAQCPWAFGHVR